MAVDHFLRNSADLYPEKAAIYYEDEMITFSRLNREVDSLAGGMLELDLAFQGKVGVILGNSPDFIRAYFAIVRAGGIVVPINPLLKGEEIIYILNDAGVSHLITFPAFLPLIGSISPMVPSLKTVLITGNTGVKDNLPKTAEAVSFTQLLDRPGTPVCLDIKESDLAACLFTSGTSGKPKGALLSHSNLMFDSAASTKRTTMTGEDENLCVLPLFHSFAQLASMIAPISLGGSITISPQFLPAEVLKLIARRRISFLCAVPSMYTALLSFLAKTEDADISSLRICISGGSPLPLEISNAYKEKYGIVILEGNGPTETSPVAYVNPPSANKPGSVGPPLDGVTVKIVDDNNRSLPPGEIGEICIKGPNVMQGYLNQPEATAETLIDGWLHTGDLGKVDEDGYVYIVDRKKDMIIVGGLNVYPREIEECLYRHPIVLEAAVIGVSDQDRGEVPKAYISLKPGTEADPKEFILYCRKHLANYKCPRQVVLIDTLPKNSTGKIDKKQIKEAVSLGLID